jgi:hypothetical protein
MLIIAKISTAAALASATFVALVTVYAYWRKL